MTSSDAKLAKIQTHFQTLSSAAPALNAASDDLTKAVTVLDEAIKRLNVGLSSWVSFRSRGVEEWEYDDDEIGYTKVDGKWGIALRRVWGDHNRETFGADGPWLFNDAPRELRLLGVDKIPELIEALGKEAADTTKKVQEKARQVRDLATAIAEIPNNTSTRQAQPVVESGISPRQIKTIMEGVRERQKFVAELLERVDRWQLDGATLRLSFSAEHQTFAGLLEGRDTVSKVADAAKKVLGYPVHIALAVEPTAPETLTSVTKGRK
jgi:hypothetical protein